MSVYMFALLLFAVIMDVVLIDVVVVDAVVEVDVCHDCRPCGRCRLLVFLLSPLLLLSPSS